MWIWTAIAAGAPLGITRADTLEVTVSTEAVHTGDGPITLTMTVHNPTDDKAVFCTYHTPFEGIRNAIFDVTRDGEEVRYAGMMAKRGPPGKKDHRRLKPGQSVQATVNLRDGYTLASGTYAVRYHGTGISGLNDSAEVSFTVE